jgi:hypothetical protein
VPNVKPNWNRDAQAASGRTTEPYEGFHLARRPKVLE